MTFSMKSERAKLFRMDGNSRRENAMFDQLKGKKTYLVALLGGLLAFAMEAGLIDGTQAESIQLMLTSFGLGALRAGIKNG